MKQEKTMEKPPYDPNPYKVVEVKGAQITCSRGGKEKKRTKEKIKVIKERLEYLRQGDQTIRDIHTYEETEVEINLNLEEENPRDHLEGVGHPRLIELIEISEDDDKDTEVQIDINREGVGHPIGANDDEEINLRAEPEIPEILEEPEIPEINEPEIPEKKKQLSPRDRRRTRSMAAAAKRKTPRKERWILE